MTFLDRLLDFQYWDWVALPFGLFILGYFIYDLVKHPEKFEQQWRAKIKYEQEREQYFQDHPVEKITTSRIGINILFFGLAIIGGTFFDDEVYFLSYCLIIVIILFIFLGRSAYKRTKRTNEIVKEIIIEKQNNLE